ncbi:MAG: GvpL/GvpF family gas vesicle protein, partial [Solirubrobacterales bacterium]|nr:GvpL/GvpF family gas vesicle protein [Solirubrobacterales bacterium]
YRDQEGVRRMLSEQEPLLLEELSELEGRREWGAKVFVDQDRLAEAVENVSEAGADEGEQLGAGRASSAGAAYMARLGREREVSERLQEFGDSAVKEIHAQFEAIADKAHANPLQRPELHGRKEQMWLNGAYLVRRERENELAQVADLLRERWSASGFDVELTGPWPPYNFVSPSAMVAP